MAATEDPNVKSFKNFINSWRTAVVSTGQIAPAYFPYFDNFVNQVAVPTNGISESNFNTKINDLAKKIKEYYVAAQYRGNLAQLSNQIDLLKPRWTNPAAPAPAPAPAPQGSRQEIIINSQKFFKNTGGIPPAVDYASIFENLRALTNSDLMDIQGLMSGTAPGAALKTLEEKVSGEITTLEEKVKSKQAQIDALNQQFVDERGNTGKVDKSKVMVLQDWILVGFTVAYFFFAVVAILYVSSKSALPGRAALAMSALLVVVSAVMYTWISYLA